MMHAAEMTHAPMTTGGMYLLAGCLMAAGIPLAMRKIPLNSFYGFRTPKTKSSPEMWLNANEKAGKNLIAAGAFTFAAWGAMRVALTPTLFSAWAGPVMVAAFVVCLAVSFVQLQRM